MTTTVMPAPEAYVHARGFRFTCPGTKIGAITAWGRTKKEARKKALRVLGWAKLPRKSTCTVIGERICRSKNMPVHVLE